MVALGALYIYITSPREADIPREHIKVSAAASSAGHSQSDRADCGRETGEGRKEVSLMGVRGYWAIREIAVANKQMKKRERGRGGSAFLGQMGCETIRGCGGSAAHPSRARGVRPLEDRRHGMSQRFLGFDISLLGKPNTLSFFFIRDIL